MSAKIYICPTCNEQFKTRKLANTHRSLKNHRGAVIVEEVIAKASKKVAIKWPKKGDYGCPKCDKKSKTLKGIQQHMAAKRHGSEPTLIESKPIVKSVGVKVEPKPIIPLLAYMKLREQDAQAITSKVEDINANCEEGVGISLIVNPENGGSILQYYTTLIPQIDDLQFTFQFVNIEMQNSDILFCLGLLQEISQDFRVYDTAELKVFGISNIEAGKVIISLEPDIRLKLTTLYEGLSAVNPHDLACVTGIWKKVYSPPKAKVIAPIKPVSTPISTPASNLVTKSLNEKYVMKKPIVQKSVQNFDDWKFDGYASETFEAFSIGGHNQRGLRTTYTPPKPVAPPEPISYPVFGITQYAIIIDRVIEYANY
tara:strand:- start:1129 stop:2235 length:1107 start_codon:yes stop_codon:yes gene_type:complete